MSRGECELRCLNLVRNSLENEAIYYAMDMSDCNQIKSMFLSAVSNSKSSQFPDFLCNLGFIEHFQISSGKTTKKGSLHKEAIAKFNSGFETGLEKFKNETECRGVDSGQSYSQIIEYSGHSYDNLVNSLQKTFKHHIDSFHKYRGNKNIGVFLIEYNEMAMSMIEDCYVDVHEMRIGDLHKQEHFNDYRLSRDKAMLDFIYEYRNDIQYVVYLCKTAIEIISVNHIPNLKSLLPWEYRIAPNHTIERRAVYKINIPNQIDT